jgi:hypothetical protein
MGNFFEHKDEIIETLNDVLVSNEKERRKHIRYGYIHSSPIHCDSIIMDPKWTVKGQAKDKEIMTSFQKVKDNFFDDRG